MKKLIEITERIADLAKLSAQEEGRQRASGHANWDVADRLNAQLQALLWVITDAPSQELRISQQPLSEDLP